MSDIDDPPIGDLCRLYNQVSVFVGPSRQAQPPRVFILRAEDPVGHDLPVDLFLPVLAPERLDGGPARDPRVLGAPAAAAVRGGAQLVPLDVRGEALRGAGVVAVLPEDGEAAQHLAGLQAGLPALRVPPDDHPGDEAASHRGDLLGAAGRPLGGLDLHSALRDVGGALLVGLVALAVPVLPGPLREDRPVARLAGLDARLHLLLEVRDARLAAAADLAVEALPLDLLRELFRGLFQAVLAAALHELAQHVQVHALRKWRGATVSRTG
eukprot:CAMPEP_0179252930 /NCGR_PEP_ID=MMETSP0797-20121207/22463_1 /TAXON_ID=47934 /ORGANISM="Dinophysis acuminata, Strain DAEP01" /LENGTH=267 /DNA_ID=CAMNT_0020960765 /DNA_START=92 /DNA_END=892 /DNA_ORIENTATION=+